MMVLNICPYVYWFYVIPLAELSIMLFGPFLLICRKTLYILDINYFPLCLF